MLFQKEILIVEDSKLNAQITADILNKYGYKTEIVTSGEEAIEKVVNNVQTPDLILIDIELRGAIDGIDTVRIIQQHKDLPILFLTANASKEIMEKVKSVSAYGYVPKGVDEYVLISQIEMVFKLYEAKTERKKVEIDLRERNAILNTIMEYAGYAIIMIDDSGNVTFWNPAAERILGYSKEEIIGKELHTFMTQDERLYEAYREAFKKFCLSGKGNVVGKTIEMKARHKDGYEIDVELSLSAVRIKDSWHAIGIIRDISERKRFEELLYRQSITDPLIQIFITGVFLCRCWSRK
ncbi:putative PAS/PAC sensor protein [Thermoanaerobacter ethanolicus JW 200]|nr:putative PAS/PAC sensor protein [Thermoanaerobacter ethanolicus JW 200]